MDIEEQIKGYMDSLPDSKRLDLMTLHHRIQHLLPQTRQWFFDGKDETGKVVANPQIGYGQLTINYADGKSREFYQVGISANTTGISVYIMGLADKTYLQETYGKTIGKASVTGYCLKFRKLTHIQIDILEEAIRDGVNQTS